MEGGVSKKKEGKKYLMKMSSKQRQLKNLYDWDRSGEMKICHYVRK